MLRQELGRMILQTLSDPRIGFVTVTRVEVAPDLSVAKVMISIMGSQPDEKKTLRGLNSARRRLQMELAEAVQIRRIPDLIFRVDRGVKHSLRISGILHDLSTEHEPPKPAEGGDSSACDEDLDEDEEQEASEGEADV